MINNKRLESWKIMIDGFFTDKPFLASDFY